MGWFSPGLPGGAEAYVRDANAHVDEEVGETGEGEQPVEDCAAARGFVDKRKEAEQDLQHHARDRAAGLVDVREQLRAHSVAGERLERPRRTVRARVGDAEHADQDDGVEDGRQPVDVGELDGNDKGRTSALRAGRGQVRGVVGDDEPDDEEVDDVEEGDAPEDLLCGFWDLAARVLGFGCGEAGEFGAAVGEGGGDEDGAEAFESVLWGGKEEGG